MQPQLVLVGRNLRKVLNNSYKYINNNSPCDRRGQWTALMSDFEKQISKLEQGEFPEEWEEQYLKDGSR